MTETASIMVPLGTKAPDFRLKDLVSGEEKALADFLESKGLLVFFVAFHCPFVRTMVRSLVDLIKEYEPKGLAAVAICSSDASLVPEDGPEKMKKFAQDHQFNFPLLYDPTQSAAKSFGAACTPDFFLYDSQRNLYYRGRFDDRFPGSTNPVTGKDLRFALEAFFNGADAPAVQNPSIGCNIKWTPGNEPDYFGSEMGHMEDGSAVPESEDTYY